MTRKALALLTLVCACLVAAPAGAIAASTSQILKDCAADSVLQGTYTAAELRKARAGLDGTGLEYTDCDLVLSRALAALRAAAAQQNAPGGGGVTPPTRSDDPGIGTPAGEPSGFDQPTAFDKDRLKAAADSGEQAVAVGGVKLVPASGVRVDTSELPAPLIVALAVLAATGLAVLLPGVRERLGRLRRLR